MTDITIFESRNALLKCTPRVFYTFVTDMRNAGRFIPETLSGKWNSDRDTFTAVIAPAGEIHVKLKEMIPFSSVNWSGTSAQIKEFTLKVHISEGTEGRATVKTVFEAALNPFIKLLASTLINDALERLCTEMEKIEDWDSMEVR
jgi:carbon monoxide dehydrogenase subunit G